jgi:membrane protease subunit HflK
VIEKLLDILVAFWDRIAPVQVVDAYEAGIVLRLGKYHRSAAAGVVWKWPLIEQLVTTTICVTTLRLPAQTLTTSDGHSVVISSVVKYQIRDPKPFLLDIWDSVDVLADVTMGAIKTVVNGAAYADLIASPVERKVLETVRKECNRYGFQIHSVTFTDMGRIRSLRLISNTIQQSLAN